MQESGAMNLARAIKCGLAAAVLQKLRGRTALHKKLTLNALIRLLGLHSKAGATMP
jgi:hypothetical protein